tara:strand:+ start:2312 stop:3616 length:1305 start_codon:yes stop_codon:yes gene_type:complete
MFQTKFLLWSYVVPVLAVATCILVAVLLSKGKHRASRTFTAVFVLLAIAALVFFGAYASYLRWLRCGSPFSYEAPAQPPSRTPKRVVAIGGGWSFLLDKKSARAEGATVLFTHHWRGELPNGHWGAGTTIGEMQRTLRRRGLTVASHPSILDTTLGGWIFSGAHGTGGSLWTSCFGTVTVRDTHTGRTVTGPPKTFFHDKYSVDTQRRYLILDVEIKPVENVWCEKSVVRICDVDAMAQYLTEPTHLRLLQIGARGTMAVLWTPLKTPTLTHVDPHIGSQSGLWLQSDVLSMLQGPRPCEKEWFAWPVEPAENFHSKVRLSDANDFTPHPLPYLQAVSLAYVNFEIFVYMHMTPSLMWGLCQQLSSTFATLHARCEMRYGDSGKLFLDFVHARGQPLHTTICRSVAQVLGTAEVYLHKGKAQVDVSPLRAAPLE